MKQAAISLGEGMKTTIVSGDQVFIADEPVEEGGSNLGPTPMQMLLGALGACTAITVKLYAQSKGWKLEHIDVSVTMDRIKAAEYPAYQGSAELVHEFRQHITITGDLDEAQRARLLEIAGKCPVHKALAGPSFFFEEFARTAAEEV